MEVLVRKPNPEPDSNDPSFWKHWTGIYDKDEFKFDYNEPNFEEVCNTWEGKIGQDDTGSTKESDSDRANLGEQPTSGKPPL
jgi:hypothetical protein